MLKPGSKVVLSSESGDLKEKAILGTVVTREVDAKKWKVMVNVLVSLEDMLSDKEIQNQQLEQESGQNSHRLTETDSIKNEMQLMNKENHELREKLAAVHYEKKQGVQHGQKVQCKVTGFSGIVTGISTFLNGCRRVGVQAIVEKDAKKVEDAQWFDEPQLRIVDHSSVLDSCDRSTGGPMPSIPKQNSNPKQEGN